MKRTTIYLTEEQRQRIHKVAQAKNITFSELIRRAIDAYLDAPMVTIKGGQYVAEIPVRIIKDAG